MGMPELPTPNQPGDASNVNAVAWVVLSVAYEELGLAHIINAEGEKIQKVVASVTNSPPKYDYEWNALLDVNESVREMLETIIAKECILNMKLGKALDFLIAHPT